MTCTGAFGFYLSLKPGVRFRGKSEPGKWTLILGPFLGKVTLGDIFHYATHAFLHFIPEFCSQRWIYATASMCTFDGIVWFQMVDVSHPQGNLKWQGNTPPPGTLHWKRYKEPRLRLSQQHVSHLVIPLQEYARSLSGWGHCSATGPVQMGASSTAAWNHSRVQE